MSELRNKIIGEHIENNYPNAKIVNYNAPDSDLTFYSTDELSRVEDDWFPLCSFKDPKSGKLMYGGRSHVYHTYTEGETGAGKTTRFVMQSLMALSSLKVKPSFVIVDIHGEIIENMYTHFLKQGYDIKILNCDNAERSDTYNPFAVLAQECLKTRTLDHDAINKIRRIAEIMQPVESSHDPIWDRGARSYTNGCILDKFEDLINGDIPPECLTIYNIIQNHHWIRKELANDFTTDIFKIPHYRRKGSETLSVQKMISVTNNAEKTRASYFGVVENHYDKFGQPTMYNLSSSNTINISDFIDKPTVIVIQSGNTTVGDDLISLLVNEIYTCVVKAGKESPTKKLPRNIHCFLDEFANCNIADGPDYIKMLTTSRKFGMFWHMILQCDAQLDRKFDADIGRIIRSNSTELFMGSNDYETTVRFAKSCGQKTIESLASVVAQQNPGLETVDLMTADKLSLTEEGCVYVKSNRHPLLKTYFEAFYNCDEFVPVDDIDTVYPFNEFDYRTTEFYPRDIPYPLTDAEVKILMFVGSDRVDFPAIPNQFPEYDVYKLSNNMADKNILRLTDDGYVESTLPERLFKLYEYRLRHGLCKPYRRISDDDPNFVRRVPFSQVRNIGSFETTRVAKTNITDSVLSIADEDDPLFKDLCDHLRQDPPKKPEAELARFTIIPRFLHDAVISICNTKGEERPEPVDFPSTPTVIKFEILEEFITNNNFGTKATWEKKYDEEYRNLKKLNLFPESIMIHFTKTARELAELTLTNIREIKKIIRGS